MAIGEKLKALRKQNGLTQNKVADDLMIGRRTYWGYEANKSSPTSETLERMSKYFHVTSSYILGESQMDSDDYLLALSGKNLTELTDDQKAAVKNVIETFLKQNKNKGK
ncbi:MAG: helix-turn-helix domain-containing protein [Bacilli bacterium]|nr:helix-turn-helix domain-containing protein [Bacilli bacterium]